MQRLFIHDISSLNTSHSNPKFPQVTIGCVVAMAVARQDNSAVSGAGQEAVVAMVTLSKILTGTIVSHVKSVQEKYLAQTVTA